MTGSFDSWVSGGALAADYTAHALTLRGVVRHALVHRALTRHVPAPSRVLDVGGGSGTQARMLAGAGHHVTILEPDPAMLDTATAQLAAEPEQIRERITLVRGRGEDAADLVGGDFDLVCCHGVLMYLSDPGPLLRQMVAAAAPGGVLSVLTKNADAIPLRPALSGRWAEATALLDTDTETGNLGVTSRGHRLDQLALSMAAHGAPLTGWYGVRVATDHLGDTPAAPDHPDAIELEWRLGQRDPYRSCARLLHLICTKTPTRPAAGSDR